MLALLSFGTFAQIRAENIPDGIIPKKRQLVGTGVTSSTSMATTETSASASPTSDSSTVEATSDTTTATTEASTSESTATTLEPTSANSTPSSNTARSTATSESESSTARPVSTSTIPTTFEITTTNSEGSTVTSRVVTRTAVPVSTTRGIASTGTGTLSDQVVIGSSTINRSTLSRKTTITSALLASETIPSTYTSYFTIDGTVGSSVVTTNRIAVSTTGYATATIDPSLQNGGGSSGSGLSSTNKAVIGGVVGGVGGAIFIGGIAIVAWRLWSKKKRGHQVSQDDFGGSQDGSIRKESTTLAGTPYAPVGGSVNTASNF